MMVKVQNMRYDADEPSMLTIIHNQRLISSTFFSFEMNNRRLTDLTTVLP